MPDQKQKTALITGSGRKRLGYVVAKRLAQSGYNIAVHYHSSEEPAKENVREFRQIGVSSESFQADVADESEVKTLVSQVNEHFGSVDVLVTTSSIWKTIPLEDTTAEDVLNSFKVNALGTFLCCRYAGLRMVEQQDGGNIVTICDALVQHPYVDHAAYFTAKGSIPTMTRCFAVEFAARNPRVRVNCISPGPVMLPPGMDDEERNSRVASTLVKRADEPNSIASAVEFLIENQMTTGVDLTIDGGRNVGLEHQRRTR